MKGGEDARSPPMETPGQLVAGEAVRLGGEQAGEVVGELDAHVGLVLS